MPSNLFFFLAKAVKKTYGKKVYNTINSKEKCIPTYM